MKPKSYQRPFIKLLQKRMQESKPLIQVLLGPRQVGKTTGVLQFLTQYHLPQHYASSDESLQATPLWIQEQWQRAVEIDKNAILVIDEIQKIPNWSHAIKGLWDQQKREAKTHIKLILLGSSSLSLQNGLTESLAGRFELIQIPHWNFHETNQISKMSLESFLKFGGYPGGYAFVDDELRWSEFIRNSIVEAVIGKDILSNVTVKSPALFRQAFEILCHYPAQEVSYNKLLGQLQDRGNIDLVKYYLDLYAGAFLIKSLFKYSGKSVLRKSSSPKILPLCPALVGFTHSLSDFSLETGRVFELAVGMELAQLPGHLYYWRDGIYEVDFVLEIMGKVFAIEAKSGRKQKKSGLEQFLKKFKKAQPLFITPDNFATLSQNGIKFLEEKF